MSDIVILALSTLTVTLILAGVYGVIIYKALVQLGKDLEYLRKK